MDKNIIISMILHGCELARKLEGSLPSMVNNLNSAYESCSEIIRAFMAAQERLNDHHHTSLFSAQQLTVGETDSTSALGMKEWLRSRSHSQEMDQCMMESQSHEHEDSTDKIISSMLCELNQVTNAAVGCGVADAVAGLVKFQTGQSSGSSRPETSSARPRRRNKRDSWRMVSMAALKIGNTEIPPDDGFTWRKYGQKEIHGYRFPRLKLPRSCNNVQCSCGLYHSRAYFRCTHHKLYHCPAKKQVQRLDDHTNIFEVTYRNDHTCHLSDTAPCSSVNKPLSTIATTIGVSLVQDRLQQYSTPTNKVGTWLPIGIGCPRPNLNPNDPFIDPRQHWYVGLHGGDTGGYNHQPVTDMADTMFNSGSSDNTTMDHIFSSSANRKWDQGGSDDVNGK